MKINMSKENKKDIAYKKCKYCGKEFIPRRKNQQYCCTDCCKINYREEHREEAKNRRKAYDAVNKEKVSENKKRYYRENKEILKEKGRIYREKHKEELLRYAKEYREKNKELISEKHKIYRKKNKEKLQEKNKRYYLNNKEKIEAQKREYNKKNASKLRNYQRQYIKENKERIKERNKKYYEEHKEHLRTLTNERTKNRNKLDANFRLGRLCRKYVRRCLSCKKSRKTEEILGYSFQELKDYIQSQFYGDMSWENTDKWEIHHIIPVAAFNFMNEDGTDNYEMVREANALENLMPLFKKEHKKLSDLYRSEKKYLSRQEIKKMIIEGD